MRKEIIISLITLFLIATPALARQENTNQNSPKNNENNENHKKDKDNVPFVQEVTVAVSPTLTPTSIPTPTQADEEENEDDEVTGTPSVSPTCDPEGEYKNHGQYVSCVAHEKRGGKETSEAARSDIGKKHEDNDDEDEEDDENENNPTPTASVTITPTVTATVSPTINPITSSQQVVEGGYNPFKTIGENLRRFFGFLLHFV